MHDIPPLLNRRPLEPGESLPSLLVRLRLANYYRSPKAITNICRPYLPADESLHLPRLTETWPVLAAVTRLPTVDLYRASFHHYTAKLALPWERVRYVSLPDGEQAPLASSRVRRFFSRPLKDAQYCPVCLTNGRYHRCSWLALPLAVCLDHECLLQCGCPNCSRKLPIAAVVAGRCLACKYDLTTASVISVSHDDWGVWVQRCLHAWLGEAPAPPLSDQMTIPAEPPAVLLEVLWVLTRAVARLPADLLHAVPNPDLALPLFTPRALPTPVQIYCTCATAMKIIACWPQAFHQFLNAYRQRPGVTEGYITAEFAPLYLSWLEKRWRRPEFGFVQTAFDDFLVANYIVSRSLTRLDRYQRSEAFRDRFPYLTQAEASERLGVELEVVQRLVELGLLVDYERSEGYQRHWHQRLRIVRRTEFNDLRARWRDGIPLVDVARLLELDRDVVENLVNGNLLASHLSANDVDDRLERIETASLNTFVRRLNRFPATPYNFGEPVILRNLIADGYDLVEILRLAISGEVKTMWHRGGLNALWVSENDVDLLRK